MPEEKNEACLCGLAKSGTACRYAKIAPELCRRCGWSPEERERRRALPLVKGADGLYHKDIRPEA